MESLYFDKNCIFMQNSHFSEASLVLKKTNQKTFLSLLKTIFFSFLVEKLFETVKSIFFPLIYSNLSAPNSVCSLQQRLKAQIEKFK